MPPVRKAQRIAAKRLRRELTPAERKLWHALRAHRFQDLHIRRQVPMGRYIADFICHANRVVIEVDGEQHGFDREAARDRTRDDWFESQGYRVLRFANGEVLREPESVLDTIYARFFRMLRRIGRAPPRPLPPCGGEPTRAKARAERGVGVRRCRSRRRSAAAARPLLSRLRSMPGNPPPRSGFARVGPPPQAGRGSAPRRR